MLGGIEQHAITIRKREMSPCSLQPSRVRHDLVGNSIGLGNRFANLRGANKHKTNPLTPEPLPAELYLLAGGNVKVVGSSDVSLATALTDEIIAPNNEVTARIRSMTL
jgi:hypothetical protein